MSCDADRKATVNASSAKARSDSRGDVAARANSATASASCVSTIQPRRRQRPDRSKRSISGAQRNLKV